MTSGDAKAEGRAIARPRQARSMPIGLGRPRGVSVVLSLLGLSACGGGAARSPASDPTVPPPVPPPAEPLVLDAAGTAARVEEDNTAAPAVLISGSDLHVTIAGAALTGTGSSSSTTLRSRSPAWAMR